MGLVIIVNGKPLDPHKAAGEFLPQDIFYICPMCGSKHVRARPARTIEDMGGRGTGMEKQYQGWIPRQQDRWCVDCDHRWTAVLAPENIAK